jgi:hypothetical protein
LNIVTIMRRIGNLQRQAIATVILIAILIAPLCAPLCGSRVCVNPSTQTEDCHSSVTANGETRQTSAGSVRACALGELPTATLGETKSSREPQEQNFVLHASPRFLLAVDTSLITIDGAIPRPDSEPHKNISLDAAVLRI